MASALVSFPPPSASCFCLIQKNLFKSAIFSRITLQTRSIHHTSRVAPASLFLKKQITGNYYQTAQVTATTTPRNHLQLHRLHHNIHLSKQLQQRYHSTTNSMASQPARKDIRGIIFDMDGTLTVPVLDFKLLRQQLGIVQGTDILGHVNTLEGQAKIDANQAILDFEEEGNKKLKLRPGLHDLLHCLRTTKKTHTALLTRNNDRGVECFMDTLMKLDTGKLFSSQKDVFCNTLTRSFEPVKPHPAAILHLCSLWGVHPSQVIMIGDDITDIKCGLNANSETILINVKVNRPRPDSPAHHVVNSLKELQALLDEKYNLLPSLK